MPELSLAELTEATGGSLLRGDPATRVDTFVIDTRALVPGGVFFALPGTRTDGHEFLDQARKAEAAAAVIEREPPDEQAGPAALIRVDDAVQALARAGHWVRRKLSGAKWVAVTGSNGKTTTKQLMAEGLSASRRVHQSPGNFNNHLGVPLALLACPEDAEIAVMELAMSAAGEIADLTRMTDPDVGLVTNVRAVHLEFFNSLDDIAATKGELFALLRDDAVSVYGIDDSHLRVQSARHVGRSISFGRGRRADLRLEEVVARFVPGTSFSFSYDKQTYKVNLRVGGAHSAFNALAALAGIVAAGENIEAAIPRIESVEAEAGRGKVYRLRGGMLLVDDCYNSSPAALASVLETLKACDPPGRRVLVMGDMLELGVVEGALHREAGKRAAAASVQLFISVGQLSRQAAESARRAGVPEVHHHNTATKAAQSIAEFLRDGDLIVVKGSRKIQLDLVVNALTSGFEEVA